MGIECEDVLVVAKGVEEGDSAACVAYCLMHVVWFVEVRGGVLVCQ